MTILYAQDNGESVGIRSTEIITESTYTEQDSNPQQQQMQQQPGGLMSMMFPLILMFGVIYLLMIRPQQKQRKEHQKMLDGLNVNDKVITSSGIIGKITVIKDTVVVLRIDEATNAKIEIMKSSITGLMSKEDDNA